MLKRVLFILAPLVFTVIALVLGLHFLKPQLDSFVSKQVRALSSSNLPVEIDLKEVTVHLLPPAIEVTDVKIAPKDPTKFGFDILEIDSAFAELDFLQMLVGKIAIQTLTLESPSTDIDVDNYLESNKKDTTNKDDEKIKKSKLDMKPFFDELKIIPIRRLVVNDLSSNIKSESLGLNISLADTRILIMNSNKELYATIETGMEELDYKNLKDSAYLNTTMSLSMNQVEISKFHLTTKDLDINLSMQSKNISNLLINPHFSGKTKIDVSLDQLSEKLKKLLHSPTLSGKVHLNSEFEFDNFNFQNTSLKLQTDNLQIDDFKIGNIETTGTWKNKIFSTDRIQITNEATLLDLDQFSIEANENEITLQSEVSTELLDLNELLKSLDVPNVPVELFTEGNFKCHGGLYPKFSIRCDGNASAEHLDVRSSIKAKDTIVEIDKFAATGFVNVDSENVQYHADIKIGDDKGQSDGTISYRDGFKITYNSPKFNFRNLKNLAGLKLEGYGALSGETKGDSDSAVFYIQSDLSESWFEDFYLGDVQTRIDYNKGFLKFQNIEGKVQNSQYQADVVVDLKKDRIQITGGAPFINVEDALSVFQRKVKLPFSITGVGGCKVQAEGPFNLSQMSYDFKSNLNKPIVLGEQFDSADFHFISKDGEVRTENIKIKKGHGEIIGQGQAHPNGQIELGFEGKNFFIEESDNVSKLGTNISGRFNFGLNLNGHILKPRGDFKAAITDIAIEDQEMPSSHFNFSFDKSGLKGTANLVAGKLKSDFMIPFSKEDPFKFEASARDWNYTTLFTLVGGAPLLSEYQASLTGDISLKSEHGGLFNSSGEGSILRARLKRGDLELVNPGPMDLIVEKGKLVLKNFKVTGKDSYLELATNGSTPQELNFKLNGKMQTHLFQVFLPFLDQLSGMANIKVSIGGSLERPEVFGNAEYEKGVVKLHDFPHSFEKINASAQFSQTKIVVNQLTATLGGGNITGDGTVTIAGLKDFPLLFRAKAENINLNIPDKMRTSGNAELTFSGNWFPFLLSGTYRINSGQITKEFGGDANIGSAQQSSYLPKILLQSAFDPLRLNIQAIIEQPVQIKNSLVDGTTAGAIQITGSPAQPILSGKVALSRNSKVNFRDKPFEVTTANVTFNDPKEINPELYILAQSRVATYDVNLNVQGQAKNPLIRLSSQPPLPEHDIISLLALGLTTANLEDKGAFQQRDQQQNLAAQLGAAVVQQISRDFQKAINVEFQISSQYDDTKNMSTQKYTLTGKVTDKLSWSGSVTRGDQSSTAYQLKYSINPQVSVTSTLERLESNQAGVTTTKQNSDQILGLDLEYKQEFK